MKSETAPLFEFDNRMINGSIEVISETKISKRFYREVYFDKLEMYDVIIILIVLIIMALAFIL